MVLKRCSNSSISCMPVMSCSSMRALAPGWILPIAIAGFGAKAEVEQRPPIWQSIIGSIAPRQELASLLPLA